MTVFVKYSKVKTGSNKYLVILKLNSLFLLCVNAIIINKSSCNKLEFFSKVLFFQCGKNKNKENQKYLPTLYTLFTFVSTAITQRCPLLYDDQSRKISS